MMKMRSNLDSNVGVMLICFNMETGESEYSAPVVVARDDGQFSERLPNAPALGLQLQEYQWCEPEATPPW